MATEPSEKRVIAFFDGQNLFHAAKNAFGYTYPNYAPKALAQEVSAREQGWLLSQVRFYTGIPDASASPRWHTFWSRKLAVMGTRGTWTFARPLRYRNQTIRLRHGDTTTTLVGQEKGIDVRIALDIVRLARQNEYDVALVFSQDQDLSEAADEIRHIARDQDRWIKIASAYPVSPTSRNKRGINHTDWIRIERDMYDSALDPMDHRTPSS